MISDHAQQRAAKSSTCVSVSVDKTIAKPCILEYPTCVYNCDPISPFLFLFKISYLRQSLSPSHLYCLVRYTEVTSGAVPGREATSSILESALSVGTLMVQRAARNLLSSARGTGVGEAPC